MTNKEFIRQYINSNIDDSAKNGNMSYNDGLLFSYNTAIAKRLPWGFLFNSTKYYSSTTAQQNLLLKQLEDGGFDTVILSDLPLNNKFDGQQWTLERDRTNKNNNIPLETKEDFLKIVNYLKEEFDIKEDMNSTLQALESRKNFNDFVEKEEIDPSKTNFKALKAMFDTTKAMFDTTLRDLDIINRKKVKNAFKSQIIHDKKNLNEFEIKVMQEFIKNN